MPPETATAGSRFLRSPAPPGTAPSAGGRCVILGKFFLWLVMIVLVAAGALAGGAWLYINESVAEVRAHSQPLIDAQQDLDGADPDQPTVALVIGYDKRLGPRARSARARTRSCSCAPTRRRRSSR
jgi:hypothetical protein